MIFNGVVENICMWDGEVYSAENPKAWQPPAGCTLVCIEDVHCGPGYTWDGKEFAPPPEPAAPAAPEEKA
jgi:hypothetical protein